LNHIFSDNIFYKSDNIFPENINITAKVFSEFLKEILSNLLNNISLNILPNIIYQQDGHPAHPSRSYYFKLSIYARAVTAAITSRVAIAQSYTHELLCVESHTQIRYQVDITTQPERFT